MTKYEPLGEHLKALTGLIWVAKFDEIERILGFRLPKSARSYPAWWNNGSGMPQSSVWIDAGWQTEDLDIGSEKITFCRTHRPSAPRFKTSVSVAGSPAILSESKISETIELIIKFQWEAIGSVTIDSASGLRFPKVPDVPGLYRFSLSGPTGNAVYIGEAERLARRFQHYRTPGPSQPTNVRIKEIMQSAIRAGGQIAVDIIKANIQIEQNGTLQLIDLSSKVVRCLAENAALLASSGQDVEKLNRANL